MMDEDDADEGRRDGRKEEGRRDGKTEGQSNAGCIVEI
jgi:hypothetical protein